MEFETLVQSRRSVRGFRKEPVPRAVIEAIIESAKRAPSSMNTQPGRSTSQGIMRSDIVREVAKIPEDEFIMTCVAMSYPDDSFAANAVRSDREHNDEFVRYVGFAD